MHAPPVRRCSCPHDTRHRQQYREQQYREQRVPRSPPRARRARIPLNLIANGVHGLLTHPDQPALLRARPALLPAAVEEALRHHGQAREERDQLVAGVALTRLGETQERWARFEAASMTVRTWHPAVPPGLLQTEAYMRSVFRSLDGKPEDEVERAVAARLRRQRESRNRRCVLLASEADLWWVFPARR